MNKLNDRYFDKDEDRERAADQLDAKRGEAEDEIREKVYDDARVGIVPGDLCDWSKFIAFILTTLNEARRDIYNEFDELKQTTIKEKAYDVLDEALVDMVEDYTSQQMRDRK